MSSRKRKSEADEKQLVPNDGTCRPVSVPKLTVQHLQYIYQFCAGKSLAQVEAHFFPKVDTDGLCLVRYSQDEDSGFGVKRTWHVYWMHKQEISALENSQLIWSGGDCADDDLSFDDFIMYKHLNNIINVWHELTAGQQQCAIDDTDSIFGSPKRPGWMAEAEFSKRKRNLWDALEEAAKQTDKQARIKRVVSQLPYPLK